MSYFGNILHLKNEECKKISQNKKNLGNARFRKKSYLSISAHTTLFCIFLCIAFTISYKNDRNETRIQESFLNERKAKPLQHFFITPSAVVLATVLVHFGMDQTQESAIGVIFTIQGRIHTFYTEHWLVDQI